jgi:hypothetical protein
MKPKVGRDTESVTSFDVLTVLLRYSSPKANPMPPVKPIRRPKRAFLTLSGDEGFSG